MALLICWPVSVAAQDAYVVGDCSLPQAEAILETGNVEARIYNDGRLFSGDPHLYRVPKSGQAHAVFAANLWVGGFVDNELRVTGSTYGPTEFWSGPLPESGGPPEDCASFDRFWRLDFEQHLDGSSGSLVLTPETQEWPVHLGAPYIDTDGIEGYHPERGDYPVMHGDSQLWWIMNDRGNTHESFRTRPLGVEVLASAFGFASENDLGNVTFYRYMISNNGSMPIENAHVAMHQDMDLGVPKDDSAVAIQPWHWPTSINRRTWISHGAPRVPTVRTLQQLDSQFLRPVTRMANFPLTSVSTLHITQRLPIMSSMEEA